MDGDMNEWMDGWMDGEMNGWMEKVEKECRKKNDHERTSSNVRRHFQ